MDWIEIKSEKGLPKEDCWVECKVKLNTRTFELYFEVSGGYTYNFLINQCSACKLINCKHEKD